MEAMPAPELRKWEVQIEFFDGTVIDAASDDDAMDRWRRVAAWTDPTAETSPQDWQERVIHRARVFHGAKLEGLTGESKPADVLNALFEEDCLYLRRK
jgi:hypothetical protein